MKHPKLLLTVAALAMTVASASAVPIITTQVDNSNTDNVLFNDSSLQHSGTFVQGNFSGQGNGFIVRFTSSSGNQQIMGSGGQATITGLTGNDPFTQLSFMLENNATFTSAVFNPDATVDGTITITVDYINLVTGLQSVQVFPLDGQGQNFFRVDAMANEAITKISFSTTNSAFLDASQFRLGGFSNGIVRAPEGGATLALLGLGLLGIGAARRVLGRK